MSGAWLNGGSLIFGMIAWGIPLLNLLRYHKLDMQKRSLGIVLSMSACAISLGMQILYVGDVIKRSDWIALLDTYGAIAVCSVVLISVTMILNIILVGLGYIKK